MGRYFEDFSLGEHFTTLGRTIGEGDITNFAGLVGDFTPIHVDEHYAKQTIFGTRIAHGPLTLSVAIGLLTQLNVLGEAVVGLLNLNWDFKGAVRIGTTVYAKVTIAEARRTSKGDTGVVKFAFDVLDKQSDELVQRGSMTVLMSCRDTIAPSR
jgi:acyl dehydratase